MWRVEIEYPGRYYPSLDDVFDRLAKTSADASGMGLGFRDLVYYFKTKKLAESFKSRLSAFVKEANYEEITIGKVEKQDGDAD